MRLWSSGVLLYRDYPIKDMLAQCMGTVKVCDLIHILGLGLSLRPGAPLLHAPSSTSPERRPWMSGLPPKSFMLPDVRFACEMPPRWAFSSVLNVAGQAADRIIVV